MKANFRHQRAFSIFIVVLLLSCGPASAVETRYQLGYLLNYQSNIRRTATDPKSEWINTLTASMQATEDTSSLNMTLDASLQRLFYKNKSFSDRTVANATGNVLWTIIPERFTWTVNDYLRETVIDPRNANIQTNRQRTNTFTTGPDLIFRAGRRDTVILGHRFIDTYQEVTNLDSQQNVSNLTWQHQLSPISILSLVGAYQDINYDAETLPDRVITDTYLRYDMARAVTTFLVELGTTEVRTVGRSQIDGDRRVFSVDYQITGNETLNLRVSDQILEAGNIIDAALTPGNALADGRFLTANVFREKRVTLSYAHGGPFVTLNLSVYTTARNYFQDATLDNQLDGGTIAVAYTVSPTTDMTFNADFSRRFYPTDGRQLDYASYLVGITHIINPQLTLTGSVGLISRRSSVPGQDYDNFTASIGITYDI